MAKKMDRKNAPRKSSCVDIPAMPKKHRVKPGLNEMHIPADLRALNIVSMEDFVYGKSVTT